MIRGPAPKMPDQDPSKWVVGDIIAHVTEPWKAHRIKARKRDNSGWWMNSGGGLADFAVAGTWFRVEIVADAEIHTSMLNETAS